MRISDCNNIMDFRRLARRNLPAPVFHYLDGGADDEWTLARNTSAFEDYELLPAQLSDVSSIDLKSTLFGEPVDWPVMISPTGASKLFHAAGEPAVARAADKFNMVYSLSTLGTTTIEDVAAIGTNPKMYQLYILKDRGMTADFVERSKAAGFKALCLTVDTPVPGNRERDAVYGFSSGKLRLRSVPSWLRHPGWLYRAVVKKDLEMVNLAASERPSEFKDQSLLDYFNDQLDRSLTWKDVEWLASRWDGPLVVKGVQTVADCRNAANAGATAVMLSNHGGRQLEASPAPVDCIAAVADALHDKLEIICDGGIRRGTHVVKALALGASACSIGRGYLYPLAAGGQAGVESGLGLLRTEIERTMALTGCSSVRNLNTSFVQERR
ncbi:MAG: alpha-hydroxy-acid oxidizing protein [Gammaproteobacteria bacterium]|nr:alpha-hydroxy-acid oxidizing protein [Gammaproteobacteria bacterium]